MAHLKFGIWKETFQSEIAFNDGYEVFLAILTLFRLTMIKYYVCVYLNNIDVYIYGQDVGVWDR